jgi:hypothetical protein
MTVLDPKRSSNPTRLSVVATSDRSRALALGASSGFGGGPVSVGFDEGEILLAFVTDQRFEIGPLRPPIAQLERVQHLADQMGVLVMIADRLGTDRDIRPAEIQAT